MIVPILSPLTLFDQFVCRCHAQARVVVLTEETTPDIIHFPWTEVLFRWLWLWFCEDDGKIHYQRSWFSSWANKHLSPEEKLSGMLQCQGGMAEFAHSDLTSEDLARVQEVADLVVFQSQDQWFILCPFHGRWNPVESFGEPGIEIQHPNLPPGFQCYLLETTEDELLHPRTSHYTHIPLYMCAGFSGKKIKESFLNGTSFRFDSTMQESLAIACHIDLS